MYFCSNQGSTLLLHLVYALTSPARPRLAAVIILLGRLEEESEAAREAR